MPPAAATSSTAAVDLLQRQLRARRTGRVWLLAAAMLLVSLLSLGFGAVPLHPLTVLGVIGHHVVGWPAEADWPAATDAIVWITRLPRVLLAVGIGAILAMAGAALQALVRNGMADPYVLGVSSGASTGAAFAITVLGGTGALVLPAAAFTGALLAILLVLVIGGRAAAASPFRLILAGLAVGYAMSSATSFLIFASDSPEASRSVMFWLLGSLANVHWPMVQLSLVAASAGLLGLVAASRSLDALAAGDETALALGISPGRARMLLMTGVSLLVGVAVAGAGSIGFVGLVVPHLARALVGPRHAVLLPASACLGAGFLVIADIGARLLFAPTEMAIGVVTGIVGAPMLLLLLRHGNRAGG